MKLLYVLAIYSKWRSGTYKGYERLWQQRVIVTRGEEQEV